VSKFVDKLQSLSKSSASPIGFHPAAELKSSVLLLVAGLSGKKVEEAKVVVDVNADAGLILNAAVLHREGVGKILMIEPSLDQGFVRAINSLDVDGVLISNGGEDAFVAVEHLLIYRRFVELLERPVMITLPSLVTRAELGNLWQAGVDGIVVPPQQTVEALAELKKMIEGLPGGTRGRRGKVGVMLPHYGAGVATEEDEEQEEEI
jgi:hypothetical protein